MNNFERITVTILTKNNEDTIKMCLDSVKAFKNIILVDSGSADRTLEIAQEYDNCEIIQKEWMGFSGQKQFAVDNAKTEWIFNLDSDEVATDSVLEFISKANLDSDVRGLAFMSNDVILGRAAPDIVRLGSKIRMFNKNFAHYDTTNLVHESLILKGKKVESGTRILHYGLKSFEIWTNKINSYSSLKSAEKFNKGKRYSSAKIVFAFLFSFIKSYIIQRNFAYGIRGFIMSMNVSYYAFLKEAKLFELYEKKAKK
jgi:glycosyltransferase involved in cell wall biosynthesis